MTGAEVDDYEFRCPMCEETKLLNASMRAALLERGCVYCGAAVQASAFSAIELASPADGPTGSEGTQHL